MKARLSYVLAVVAVFGIASQSFAGPVSIFQRQNTGTGGQANTTTNDIEINAPAGVQIGSMEILLQLTTGTIYEHSFGTPAPAANNPPQTALLAPFPDLAFDTFLTAGELTDTNPLILGPSLRLGGPTPTPATAVFNATTYDASYGPPLGQDNAGKQSYNSARLTLSNTSNGTFKFRVDFSNNANAGSGYGTFGTLQVVNGVIVPEPATVSLIGLAVFGLVGFARRRK